MTKIIVYYVVLITIFCVGIFTAIQYLISRETTDDESDINTLYLDSFKSKNNCKSFETNPNLLDKNGKPVEIVTNGAIVIHTQRLKSDPGGNLLS